MKALPHRCEHVKGTRTWRVVHPDTGGELGRFAEVPGGWAVALACLGTLTRLPDLFPTRHAARQAILEAHEPEPEN